MIRRPVLLFSVIYACGELAAFYTVERSSPLLFFFALFVVAATCAGLEREVPIQNEYSGHHAAQMGKLAMKHEGPEHIQGSRVSASELEMRDPFPVS